MKLDALDFSALESALATDKFIMEFAVRTVDTLTEQVSNLAVDLSSAPQLDPSVTLEGFFVDTSG